MGKKEMGRKTRDASLMQRTQATSPPVLDVVDVAHGSEDVDATISNVRHIWLAAG
jgi:hypothetical protein